MRHCHLLWPCWAPPGWGTEGLRGASCLLRLVLMGLHHNQEGQHSTAGLSFLGRAVQARLFLLEMSLTSPPEADWGIAQSKSLQTKHKLLPKKIVGQAAESPPAFSLNETPIIIKSDTGRAATSNPSIHS